MTFGAHHGFLHSALVEDASAFADVLAWFERSATSLAADVQQVPLSALDGWRWTAPQRRLVHKTGRFYSVDGYRIRLTHPAGGPSERFDRPLVSQPEVGILGFLTTVTDGVRRFLTQVKMEPGNVGQVQLAPTVQATYSNYTRVHGGWPVPYVEYFRDPDGCSVLIDELQTEQGAYFLGKRNRNVVVETDQPVDEHPRFRWLALADLKRLLRRSYTVNMDARSVLSCLPLADGVELAAATAPGHDTEGFGAALVRSSDPTGPAECSELELERWWVRATEGASFVRRRRSLDRLDGWALDDEAIRPLDGGPFRVIGVAVEGSGREVSSWTQPMIARAPRGLLGLLTQMRAGNLHVLVQAGLEPGSRHGPQLMPTVVCHGHCDDASRHTFIEAFQGAGSARTRFAANQSEEGGRFWRVRYEYRIVEADPDVRISAPPSLKWMTLAQLARRRGRQQVSIETRNLLACLDPADRS